MKPEKKRYLELTILAVLVLVFSAILIFQPQSGGNRSLPDWAMQDNPAPDLIQVIYTDTQGLKNSYELEPSGPGDAADWIISPLNRKADSAQISNLLKETVNLQPVDLMGEEGSDKRFGLEENTRIELTLHYDKHKSTFFIGNPTPSGHYFYIRKKGDTSVYTARGSLPDRLNQDPSSFRDKQVLNFQAEALESLVFIKGGEVKSIKRDDEDWRDSNGVIPDSRELNSYVKRAAGLKCLEFTTPSESDETQKKIVTVLMQFADSEMEPVELTIIQKYRDSYLTQTANSPDLFLITRYDGEFLIRLSGFGEDSL